MEHSVTNHEALELVHGTENLKCKQRHSCLVSVLLEQTRGSEGMKKRQTQETGTEKLGSDACMLTLVKWHALLPADRNTQHVY